MIRLIDNSLRGITFVYFIVIKKVMLNHYN